MTYGEMAREIERRRPGTLPKDIGYVSSVGSLTLSGYSNVGVPMRDMVLRDDIASAILRDAMVMATMARREFGGWSVLYGELGGLRVFSDYDHANDPTASLFAAFCAVFP
jgi:hypothetical protein